MRFTDVQKTYTELFPTVKPKPVRLVETPVGTKTEEELKEEEPKEDTTIERKEESKPNVEVDNGHNEPDNNTD